MLILSLTTEQVGIWAALATAFLAAIAGLATAGLNYWTNLRIQKVQADAAVAHAKNEANIAAAGTRLDSQLSLINNVSQQTHANALAIAAPTQRPQLTLNSGQVATAILNEINSQRISDPASTAAVVKPPPPPAPDPVPVDTVPKRHWPMT